MYEVVEIDLVPDLKSNYGESASVSYVLHTQHYILIKLQSKADKILVERPFVLHPQVSLHARDWLQTVQVHHFVQRVLSGSVSAAGSVVAEVQQYIKVRALECEECVFTASGQADTPEEPEAIQTGAPHSASLSLSDSRLIVPRFIKYKLMRLHFLPLHTNLHILIGCMTADVCRLLIA